MKKVTTLLTAVLLIATGATAQNSTRGKDGNFAAIKTVIAAHDSTTTYTYTDNKGNVEPVFVGKRHAYYLARTSKPSKRNGYKGKYYRKYLKTDD